MKRDLPVKPSPRPALAAPEPCLLCGRPTQSGDYIINPGAGHELPCCSAACFDRAKTFTEYDRRRRPLYYGILFLLVVANLILIGFEMASRWMYLPMLGIGVATLVFPLAFTRYERYQKFGIRRTQVLIRIFAAAVVAFALVLTIAY